MAQHLVASWPSENKLGSEVASTVGNSGGLGSFNSASAVVVIVDWTENVPSSWFILELVHDVLCSRVSLFMRQYGRMRFPCLMTGFHIHLLGVCDSFPSEADG